MTAPAEIMYHRVSWVVESKLVTLSCDACTWPRVIGQKRVRTPRISGRDIWRALDRPVSRDIGVLRILRFEATVSNDAASRELISRNYVCLRVKCNFLLRFVRFLFSLRAHTLAPASV